VLNIKDIGAVSKPGAMLALKLGKTLTGALQGGRVGSKGQPRTEGGSYATVDKLTNCTCKL
jgi:hypothetical protein